MREASYLIQRISSYTEGTFEKFERFFEEFESWSLFRCTCFRQKRERQRSIVDKRVEYLQRMIASDLKREWTLKQMADEVNTSVSHLNRLFKAETGAAPLQYLRELRLQAAAAMLANTFLTVKEVRFRSGMYDKAQFTRTFKARFGRTPVEYKNRLGDGKNGQ